MSASMGRTSSSCDTVRVGRLLKLAGIPILCPEVCAEMLGRQLRSAIVSAKFSWRLPNMVGERLLVTQKAVTNGGGHLFIQVSFCSDSVLTFATNTYYHSSQY